MRRENRWEVGGILEEEEKEEEEEEEQGGKVRLRGVTSRQDRRRDLRK